MSRDGFVYLCDSIDDVRIWWTTLAQRIDGASIWRVEVDGLDLRDGTFRARLCSQPISPERLELLWHGEGGEEPVWSRLDLTARGISVWHKDTPETFWERMRDLHGPDIGP